MLRRRPAPADPVALVRLAAVSRAGWVPPPVDLAPQAPQQGLPEGLAEVEGALEATDAARGPRSVERAAPTPPAGAEPSEGVVPSQAWCQTRWDPGRRGLLVLAVVAVAAALLTAAVLVRGRPRPVPAPAVLVAGAPVSPPGPAAAATGGARSGEAAGGPAPGAEVVVAVSGRVRRPGLVRLPAGSRVDDAVRGAGGARRPSDLALVNLARRLVDGEQVLIGVSSSAAVASGGAAAGGPVPGGPVPGGSLPADSTVLDLNTATAVELDALPGIGAVLAQRIVEVRTARGRFGSVDQLREVEGIGEAKFAQLRNRVRV